MFFFAADPLKSVQCYLKQTHLSKQGCFPPLCPAHLYPSELSVNSVSDYDLDAMSATTRLGVYF